MARYPAIKLGAVRELWKQQRYSPPEALRRQVERIEKLSGEIERTGTYPAEWVVYRVTGYRPDMSGVLSEPLPGAQLMADLPALAERLSAAAGFTWAECVRAGGIGMDALATRWSVSRKTVERGRASGLVARRVLGPGGRPQLVYMPATVKHHEERHRHGLEKAGEFSRISAADRERMLARAARYRRILGLSAHESAQRIAPKFGRSVEAVRQLIVRELGAQPGAPSRPGEEERRAAWRDWRRGADFAAIAKAMGHGRSREDARRAVRIERARLLRGLVASGALGGLSLAAHPSPIKPPASDPARTGLGAPGQTDLLAFISNARPWHVPLAYEERARGAAYQGLRAWARGAIAKLDPNNPAAAELDRIETALRYASRLKAELVRSQLPLMLQTLESALGARLEDLPAMTSARLRELVMAALAAVGEAVDGFHPPAPSSRERGALAGRLAAPVTLGVTRIATHAAVAIVGSSTGKRAQAILTTGVELPDWTMHVSPWQDWLDMPREVLQPPQEPAPETPEPRRATGKRPSMPEMLAARYGWSGAPPMTLQEIAAHLGVSSRAVADLEQAARRIAAAMGAPRAERG